MPKLLKLKPEEAVQRLLDIELGEGKAKASFNGKIIYLFPETHHGCNEMECGTWTVSAKGVQIYISKTYETSFEILKNGTSSKDFSNTIRMQFDQIFAASNVKEITTE
jgi:hypothetical protein